ncbi:unnamed protein product [Thelazia callipaeda]|uniref:Secreted protein n=1 Tax=Thelazia callipaeda TaxID=103827 RepID=A0A0N5DCJ4_THECL|nr:unnamed protein product [Thelazia callipaeda]
MSGASLYIFVLSLLVHYLCAGPAKLMDSALLSNATTSLQYNQTTTTTIESLQKRYANDKNTQSTGNDDRQQLSTIEHIEGYDTENDPSSVNQVALPTLEKGMCSNESQNVS